MAFLSQRRRIDKRADLQRQPAKRCIPGDPHLPFRAETGSGECNLQKSLSLSAGDAAMWTFCFPKAA